MKNSTFQKMLSVCGALALFCLGAHARAAGPEGLFGAGADAISRGGAFTAVADDFSAVFYNPAGLTQLPSTQLSFGILTSYPDLYINDERLDHDRAKGGYLGFAAPISGGRVGLGAMIYLPQDLLLDIQSVSPETPHAVLFEENRTQVLSAYLGGAFAVIPDKLSLGAAIQIVPSVAANADLSLSDYFGDPQALSSWRGLANTTLGDGNCDDPSRMVSGPFTFAGRTYKNCRSFAEIDVDAVTRVSPIFGMLWTPSDRLSLGLSFRHESGSNVGIGIDASLETLMAADFGIDVQALLNQTPTLMGNLVGVQFFSPNELSLGVAVRPTQALEVSFDLLWADWSKYRDPRSEAEFLKLFATFRDNWIPPNTIFDDQELRTEFRTFKRPRFRDVIIPRIGVEYSVPGTEPFLFVGDVDFNFRFGYAFEKSPLRDNQGSKPVFRTRNNTDRMFNTGTNFLDADKHIFSFGLGIESRRPFKANLDQYIPADRKHVPRVSIPSVRFQALDLSYQHIVLSRQRFQHRSISGISDHRPAHSLGLDGSVQTGAFNMTFGFE